MSYPQQEAPDERRTFLGADVRHTIAAEQAALSLLHAKMPDNHQPFLSFLSEATGKIVFSGIGKSGHVGRLLAATFASVGLPALFLHPTEAVHGDSGVLEPGDVCVLISKSGSTKELVLFAHTAEARGVRRALLCCNAGTLADVVDLVIELPFDHEACNFNMVPTSSIVVTLAYGHGVALELAHQNGLTPKVFGRMHPAGSLGKNLLLTVNQCMITGTALPLLSAADSFATTLGIISRGCKGVGVVVGKSNQLLGVVTDGDLRRAAEVGPPVFTMTACDIMTPAPHTISPTVKAQHALTYMNEKRITSLIVVDDNNQVCGLVHVHDLVAAGVTSQAIIKEPLK